MLPLSATSDLFMLHPNIREGMEELLHIQFHLYACNGLLISTTSHHRVADRRAIDQYRKTRCHFLTKPPQLYQGIHRSNHRAIQLLLIVNVLNHINVLHLKAEVDGARAPLRPSSPISGARYRWQGASKPTNEPRSGWR
ncbi:hypothetical protein IEQ34_008458 [Dendrobium chrysotoxum]|uniref:Uncharacterized protein n=1 Tax=Dendrobium chrysotoxum TaxID=161865 RepID=A0AAV7GZB9_DENCH|nr:hypothetical protein IEQ34_008458 [Dendrobium chrysotoxum]